MDCQLSITDGDNNSLTMTKEFAVLPLDESGDGTKMLRFMSSASVVGKGSDKVNGKDNVPETTNPRATEPAKDMNEVSSYVETTVEVCVKMVVSRKYITNTVDSKTGQVISCNVTTEEDPPTILNVHTYKTPTDLTQPPSATCPVTVQPLPTNSVSTPTSAVKRRPGRPRKCPPSLTHMSQPKTPFSGKRSDPAKKDNPSVSAEILTGEAAETSVESDISKANYVDRSEDTGEADKKAENKPIVSAPQQASSKVSPGKQKPDKHKASASVKRRPGRPSRVIKKPRKYLDDYDEEFFKSESVEMPEDNNKKEDSDDGEEGTTEDKDKEEGGEEEAAEAVEEGMEKTEEVTEGEEGGEEQRTECPKCGKKFSNPSSCHRHILKDQCSQNHQCGFCDKLFDTRALLESHVESHRDQESQNTFRCADCNRTYATRNGYLKHKRQGTCYKRDVFHEDGTQGEFECPLCRVRFTTDKLLELHKEKVHENPNNEFKCPDCNRVFYSKLGFTKHVAKKSCTQPHECKVCGKKYSNKAKESFKSHMRYHLAETSGVQFQCEDCGRVYMTDMALRKHRLTSHSGLRPYKCSTCSKTFPMRYMVRDHERSHTGEKPFLCNLCGTSFSNRGHLYRHMRSHSLGTLHKRGRPRKYPLVSRSVLLKLKDGGEMGGQGAIEADLGEREGGPTGGSELGVVEIKTDPLQSDAVVQEDMGSLGAGPTYITVHTIDGQLGDPAATQGIIGEGQLQHVVMETPDGMPDNMVLQVIRDLTGATTVYQHITEQSAAAASTETVLTQPPQIIMSAAAPPQPGGSQQTLVVEPGVTDSMNHQPVVTAQLTQSDSQHQQQYIVATSQTPVSQTLS
ncbi:uncharacterized protein LOC143296968 [Babylonia areolata]|uniref:uncharacterized protein LOC143296968 n=1 Tax=Babylonia areolata TaxID=304850 RepID=UPI003FD0BFC4